jgi:predicted transcriptional regulator
MGEERPEIKLRTVSFRVTDYLYRELLMLANAKLLSVSDIIRQAILEYIEKERKRLGEAR